MTGVDPPSLDGHSSTDGRAIGTARVTRLSGIDVLWLDDERCLDPSLVGNKASTLAGLRQRGYPVPGGFCVTAPALRDARSAWSSELVEALKHLRGPWVARSSSTAEDSSAAAFPGLFATVVDLPDARSVIEGIRTVFASHRSKAVSMYAASVGVDPLSIAMSVLVQTLVVAEAAGVAFSFDPVSGAPEVTIEANYGLGGTVVDGTVVPDGYWVDDACAVVRVRIGSKREKIVATTSAARVRRLPTSKLEQSARVLTDEQAVAVAEVTRRLQRDLGQPVDVEWAFDRDSLYVLQARPITTSQPSLRE